MEITVRDPCETNETGRFCLEKILTRAVWIEWRIGEGGGVL